MSACFFPAIETNIAQFSEKVTLSFPSIHGTSSNVTGSFSALASSMSGHRLLERIVRFTRYLYRSTIQKEKKKTIAERSFTDFISDNEYSRKLNLLPCSREPIEDCRRDSEYKRVKSEFCRVLEHLISHLFCSRVSFYHYSYHYIIIYISHVDTHLAIQISNDTVFDSLQKYPKVTMTN